MFPCFIPFDTNFEHNKYNSPNISPEQTHLQNAGSAEDEFVSCSQKFVGKIDANLASWSTFLWQIFADKIFTVVLLL